jgi:hypothetical protein
MNGLDVDLQFAPQLGRHTDGVNASDSERAVANHYSRHGVSFRR